MNSVAVGFKSGLSRQLRFASDPTLQIQTRHKMIEASDGQSYFATESVSQ